MDAGKKDLERLEAEFNRLGQQISAAQAELGRRFLSLKIEVSDPELLPYLQSAESLRTKIESCRSDAARIVQCVRKRAALDRERREAEATRERLIEERRSRFAELGAGAFALYQTLSDPAPWRPLFAPLDRLEAQALPREEELRTLEERDAGRGFLDRIKLKARKILVRGELNRFDKTRLAALAEAGAAVAASEFRTLAKGPLKELFEGLESRRCAAESLATDNAHRSTQAEELRLELERMGALADPEAAASSMKRRIEALGAERDVVHGWVGRLLLDRGLATEVRDADLAAGSATVAALQESQRQRRQQIDRIRAEAELVVLSGAEAAARARRTRLEETLADTQRGIDRADFEINTRIRRREELRRVIAGELPYGGPPPAP